LIAGSHAPSPDVTRYDQIGRTACPRTDGVCALAFDGDRLVLIRGTSPLVASQGSFTLRHGRVFRHARRDGARCVAGRLHAGSLAVGREASNRGLRRAYRRAGLFEGCAGTACSTCAASARATGSSTCRIGRHTAGPGSTGVHWLASAARQATERCRATAGTPALAVGAVAAARAGEYEKHRCRQNAEDGTCALHKGTPAHQGVAARQFGWT